MQIENTMKMTPKQLRASLRKEAQAINERNRLPGDPHYKEPRSTRELLASRCSKCNEAVGFAGYKALNAFLNTGRVCDVCISKALAEDTFSRIKKSNAAQDAHARKFGG